MSHVLYLLVVVISAAFLQTPPFSRLLLLLLVPLNAWAEIKQKPSLGFTAMITFILLTVLCRWFAILHYIALSICIIFESYFIICTFSISLGL